MIKSTHALVLIAVASATSARAQHIHRVPPVSPEQAADNQRRALTMDAAQKEVQRARKRLDAGDRSAVEAFDRAADLYASVPDRSSEAEVLAEWSFEQSDYPSVVRLSARIDQIDGHATSLLQLAIAECRLGHPERALPRLARWRAMDYCESGKIIETDLPVELSPDARSVEATAWLILSFHREQGGRPSRAGYLKAQRLAPTNPAVAARLVEVGIVEGDFALARRNAPLTRTSKNPAIRDYQGHIMGTIDLREREAKAKLKDKATTVNTRG